MDDNRLCDFIMKTKKDRAMHVFCKGFALQAVALWLAEQAENKKEKK